MINFKFLNKTRENEGQELKEKTRNKWWLLLIIIVAFFILASLAILAVIGFEIKYKYEFFPGSHIGNVSLEGLGREQALALITPLAQKIEDEGIKLNYNRRTYNLLFSGDPLNDPDLSQAVFSYDQYETVDKFFALGHGDNFLNNIKDQWNLFFNGRNQRASYFLNKEALRAALENLLGAEDKPAVDAQPKIIWKGSNYQVELASESDGVQIDYEKAVTDIENNLAKLSDAPVAVASRVIKPKIARNLVADKLNLIDEAMAAPMPSFTYQDKKWQMDKKDLAQMLEFSEAQGIISLSLNHGLFQKWFEKNISVKVDVEPKNAQLEMQDGELKKLSAHQAGIKADMEKAYSDALGSLILRSWPVQVQTQTVEPDVNTEDINDLGIKEIIGIGESNFAGSPSNRIHNIKTGASKVHGVLIKPGEEFSLINTLGDVDASTGYLPELVIKGNKTAPEYGGGLCQIGTTVFRAAMASGLPITERRNHSYNVSYYLENGLPGVDATIYIPHPDVRFLNDTGHYILVQARIEGTLLKFEFWGTKDGRVAERTKPKVWDWVSPPPTKLVETTELKPGQKKCTESSHKGVKASFDYIVTLADGEQKKQNFYSVYKPWQAVCLIGVDPSKVSSSTEAVTPPTPNNSSTTASN